jgi:hypothetical protein
MEWTRTNVRVHRLFYTSKDVTQLRRSQSATDAALLCLRGIFSQERFRGESPAEVQPVDEVQAAHELQAAHEVRAAHERRVAHGAQAAHERPCSHSSEW